MGDEWVREFKGVEYYEIKDGIRYKYDCVGIREIKETVERNGHKKRITIREWLYEIVAVEVVKDV